MRILFAWELGHNYGHATQIAAVAKALAQRRGTEIWMALKNPAAGLTFSKDFKCRILQAPYHPVKGGKRHASVTYAEGLLPCGYDSADNLYPLIESWRSLFDLVKPDVLIAQAAPTALLASRGAKFKRVAFGKTFDMPPMTAPMPPFRYWKKNDDDSIKRREVAIINAINKALVLAKIKPIKKFCEILETDKNFVCSYKEFDHYPKREPVDYYGPLYEAGTGEKMDWRKGDAKRIFAYIRPGPPVFAACADALRRLPAGEYDAILAAPGLPEAVRKKLETPSLRVIAGPVKLDGLLKKCDLAINHASAGFCYALAAAGVPMLMLPMHIEQIMFARAVGRAGLGRALIGNVGQQHITEKIRHILSEKKYAEAAQKIAAQYKDSSPEKAAKKLADDIRAMV